LFPEAQSDLIQPGIIGWMIWDNGAMPGWSIAILRLSIKLFTAYKPENRFPKRKSG